MKKILLFLLLLAFGTGAIAQNLQIFYDGDPVEPAGTLQIICDPSTELVTAYIACKNNGASSLSVKTKKIIQPGDTLAGTSNYFCWAACFPPFIYVSPTSVMIDPGSTSNDFYADYEPRAQVGTSIITYVFFDENNPLDSAAVTVEWKASPSGIAEELFSKARLSGAYPNPASRIAAVDYEIPEGLESGSLIVTNLLGATVREIILSQRNGKVEIPVEDLNNGIYFYTLRTREGLALTRKLIVRH